MLCYICVAYICVAYMCYTNIVFGPAVLSLMDDTAVRDFARRIALPKLPT